MIEFGLAFLVILLIVAGMSVGVMVGRKPLKGSCGGLKALGMGTDCEICGGDPKHCDKAGPTDAKAARKLASDVSATK